MAREYDGYNEKALSTIINFKTTCPEGFQQLREYISNLKAGRKFSSEQYLVMFDALIKYCDLNKAWKCVQEQGISCTKNPLEKVLSCSNWFVGEYEYKHPYDIEVVLSDSIKKQVDSFLNALLEKHGFQVNDDHKIRVLCKRIDGERFDNNTIWLEERKEDG